MIFYYSINHHYIFNDELHETKLSILVNPLTLNDVALFKRVVPDTFKDDVNVVILFNVVANLLLLFDYYFAYFSLLLFAFFSENLSC
jgi:hypothetical protein